MFKALIQLFIVFFLMLILVIRNLIIVIEKQSIKKIFSLLMFFGGFLAILNSCGGLDSPLASYNETSILTFTIPNQIGETIIDDTTHAVSVQMPVGTILTSLVPAITISDGATISPLSDVSQSFTDPVTYTVTAKDGTTTQNWEIMVRAAGQVAPFTYNSLTFNMMYVPGGLTFPKGVDDLDTATVADAYWIGETEVTYELWYTVYTWATTGEHGYMFAHAGKEGSNGITGAAPTSNNQPVTTINWRDAMVFSNALTEWYNATKGTNYSCVYNVSGTPIRDSRDSNGLQCDNTTQDTNANGFRLPTFDEWELSAKYIGTVAPTVTPLATNAKTTVIDGVTYYWTPGDYASGATADYLYTLATDAVAWSGLSGTQAVKLLVSNALGLYDMCGNVREWNYDWSTSVSGHAFRGSSWFFDDIYLQIGYLNGGYNADQYIGFRLSRTDL